MNSFSQLSDPQIDAIYQFITEESARLGVGLDSTYYVCQPYLSNMVQPVYGEDTNTRTIRLPLGLVSVKSNPYFGKIYNLGWYNCDLFVNDSTAQPAVVKVHIPNADQYDELLVGILFDQLNANIQLVDYGTGQFETNRNWAIRLPQVPARMVVIGIRGKRWYKYEQRFTIGTSNEFIATMQAVSSRQMNEFIGTNAFKQPEIEVANQPCMAN